jgi:hypothetical protein
VYVHDICYIVWEILRLRRCKVIIINAAFRTALEILLKQLLNPGPGDFELRRKAEGLSEPWFTDKAAKKQILEMLNQFGLDELASRLKRSGRCHRTSSCSKGC